MKTLTKATEKYEAWVENATIFELIAFWIVVWIFSWCAGFGFGTIMRKKK